MASGSRFPRQFVDDCNENDVIFGRGKGSYNNPGNKHLQHIIRQHFPQYDLADLQTKNILAHKVVDTMLTKKQPSRFLKADKDTNRWYAMAREEVVKKIKQDFANLKSAHKRKIEDDPAMPEPPKKRQAKDPGVAVSTLLAICHNDGSEEEVQSEMSSIMGAVNHVFVHNPRLDHQQQAELVLSNDAVKEAIVSILQWKSQRHADMHPEGLKEDKINLPNTIPNHPKSNGAFGSNKAFVMPYARRLPKKPIAPAIKTDPTHMEKVCDSVDFEPRMDDVNKICPKLRVKGDRTYTGSVMDTNPHGIGFMKFDDGRIYCGGWRKGKLHGNACVLYKNGDKFLGEYVKNKRTGEGVCYYNDGAIYQGEFKNDRLNGKGAYRSRSGDVYDGDFVNGIFEGVGVHRRVDGTERHGRFSNWKFIASADGEVTSSDGEKDDSSIQHGHGNEPSCNSSATSKDDDEEEDVHQIENDNGDEDGNEKPESDEKPVPEESAPADKANENDSQEEGSEQGSQEPPVKMETDNDTNGTDDNGKSKTGKGVIL
ncbi:unnamed protein product [Cylindrotheca closterium]|uniref:DUF6824 domain-containing protein n=1 Tax=Cylindrotheca closterium TaxID=2856 RepID=A0AAD2FR00_9STRA|nr:unnamed protein product [Cylindrotheca closterium]